ncbi:hypothetical protein Tcan_11544 [Toxocara canis]|uniref:Uncharacterized protein n=1 Tax=Toxocara canis TaxID=6265 RepID=A0A0B2UQW0_TOXCA|nr:hypothetical protein Tcan_11544 [Toxocara canis]
MPTARNALPIDLSYSVTSKCAYGLMQSLTLMQSLKLPSVQEIALRLTGLQPVLRAQDYIAQYAMQHTRQGYRVVH